MLQKKNLVKYKFLKKGTRILDILNGLVHLRFWRLSYENNILPAKDTLASPRLISMCLDEKFNKTLYFYYTIGSFLSVNKLFFKGT